MGLSTHAEEAVIENFRKKNQKIRSNRLRIIVIRINSKGQLADSRPCNRCVRIMQQAGIKRVTYSNADGKIITSKLEDILPHASAGEKCLRRTLEIIDSVLNDN